MDKSKNRTDMLAAGRRKLQQFREKKGGGGPTKSSSSLAKPVVENESKEPSISTSVSGSYERTEELPSKDAQGESLFKVASSIVGHDLNATSPSDVSPEVAGTSLSEVVHESGSDPSVFYVNSHSGLAEKQNKGAHQMGKEEIEDEISSSFHNPIKMREENESFLCDKLESAGLKLAEEMEKEAYPEQNSKGSASHEVPIFFEVESERISSDGEKVGDDAQQVYEDKMKAVTFPAVYLDPAEESRDVGSNISHEFNRTSSLEERMECSSSYQDISVNHGVLHLELGERANEEGIEHHSLVEVLSMKDECHGKHLEEVVSVKEIVLDAHKDRLSPLQMYRMTGSLIGEQFVPNGTQNQNFVVEVDCLKTHLYLSYIEKDILQLHFVEQAEQYEYFHDRSTHEVRRLFDLVKEAQKSEETVTKELMQCKSELHILSIVKDEIENSCLSVRREIEQEHIKCCKLECELQKSQEDSLHFSEDLALYRGSLDALQKENSTLFESLVSETDARKKLVEEVEYLSSDQMKLTAALVEEAGATKKMAEERAVLSSENMNILTELISKEKTMQITLEKNMKLQDSLTELGSCLEQLIEENIYLSCNLDLHKGKIKEIGSWMSESTCHSQGDQIGGEDRTNCTPDRSQTSHEEPNVDANFKSNSLFQAEVLLSQKVDDKDPDSYILLKGLMEQLQQAKGKLQDLEKSLQGMHSQSLMLSGSGTMATTAGVSKLIKTFESKGKHIGVGGDDVSLTVGERPEDSYTASVVQTLSLRNILNRMELEMEKVKTYLMVNQHKSEALIKFNMDCESQKHLTNNLEVAFDGFARKVVNCDHQIYETQNNIDQLEQRVSEEAAEFLNEIELLKKKVGEDLFIFKQERDAIVGMILEALGKLDASTGLKVLEDQDTRLHLIASVDAAILSIEKLHGKLEETSQNYNTLHDSHEELNKSFINIQGRHSLVIELFYRFYSNLTELIDEAQQDAGNAALNANFDEVLETLPEKCEIVVNYLRNLLSERVYQFSRNNNLNLDLSIRNQEIEELTTQLKELEFQKNIRDELESTSLIKTKEIEEIKRRCLLLANQLNGHQSCKDSYVHARSCEIGAVSRDANDAVDSCNSIILQLEELVSFHLHNYEEIVEEIMLSWKHLEDANMLMEASADTCFIRLPTLLSQVIIPKVFKLQEKLNLLTSSNVEKETEIQILKDGVIKMEESLEASYHEFQLKASEVEQLEQKLSSVREKLSIAVAKGKGLILQRDSLKQALMEKTSELEKYTQELLRKESLLDELEAKLKSCSEVDRIEALESELLYIRNSATALRDSFLQKDSVLQRIEEILENLDLPDDFHDKDILEKVELLCSFAIGHPSTVNDLEQKSFEERTHSDARECAVTDSNMSYLMSGSNPDFDELKIKHEELQGKFYGLAEHNDMLEHSLLERNNLVKKWEEILGRIDLPSNILTTEPEDKVELLGKVLFDLRQERDTLQLKIDNLEISSDMLVGDIEESHKRISELTAEVVTVKAEKEFFSESIEKLRAEYLALLEKAIHDEQDRENLLKELDDLQNKLIGNAQLEYYKGTESFLLKLYDMVNSALIESDKVDCFSGGNLAENLEESLKKLIEGYAAHLNKTSNMIPDKEVLINESTPYHGKVVPEESSFDKESDMTSMRLELDHAYRKLASVEEDRDAIFVKYDLLRLEIDNLKMQLQLLNVEKNEDLEKYQSLLLELDAMGKQRDSLQEQLIQEEQKSTSLKEKLNLAVRKGKGLVQQRDSLKQTIDEMNALLEQLKIDYSQQTEALKSEKSLLMNQLAEMEQNLQYNNQNYSRLLNALNSIDFEGEHSEGDPAQKLRVLSSIILDVRSRAAAAELEANRSKRAAELLLAELNEVQERNDSLQDELVKMEATFAEYSKQRDDSLSRLEHFMSVHSMERVRLANSMVDLMSGIDQLRTNLLWSSRILAEVLSKNVDLFSYVEDLKELSLEGFCRPERNNQIFFLSSSILSHNDAKDEEPIFNIVKYSMHQHLDETLLFEHFALACQTLHQCTSYCNEQREHICKHSELLDKKMVHLPETIDAVKRKNLALKHTKESLDRDITHLESTLKEKDAKIILLYRNLTLLYETCSTSVLESVRRKSQIMGNSSTLGEDFGNLGIVLKLPSYDNLEEDGIHVINDQIKVMAKSISSIVKNASYTDEFEERTKKELKDTILALQRELQEKDIQLNKVCEELVSQIRDAEAVAKRSMAELYSSRTHVSNLEKKAELMEDDRKLLESKLNELQNVEALSKLSQERINSLADTLIAKDQEIEALMQTLDEEETQMEVLERNNKDMENLIKKKVMELETLEASQIKSMSKLSTTVRKFDELHNLSESLLTEIEILQSQLQQRDSEISFLRQEVTRSTNNVLASQETSKKHSSEVHELLTWMNALVSRIGGPPLQFDDQEMSPIGFYIGITDKKITSAITELEELRATVQCKDALLEAERSRVQELLSKAEDIETSLHGMKRLEQSQVGRSSEQQSSSHSLGASEMEKMIQRTVVSSAPIATHVRSGRKVNNDQITIAIDTENDAVLEDEDDDKSHGFKSLVTSRLVPRATRPVVDRIDGIWVSAQRLLMRQPTLRLAFFMYWITLHALLASFI